MKGKVFLTALCVVSMFCMVVLGMQGNVFAKTGAAIEDTTSAGAVENAAKTNVSEDKGSPMHAWLALISAGKKAGDTITTKDFELLRNWSASTRGYELQSLVSIGVLARTDKKGEYRLLVDATREQVEKINESAKPIINKTGRSNEALGLDAYRLDAKYIGADKLEQVAGLIAKETSANVTPAVAEDLVQEGVAESGVVAVSAVINEPAAYDIKINGANLTAGSADLLNGLVAARLVASEGKVSGKSADFSEATIGTVMFKDTYVISNADSFKNDFNNMDTDQVAVIIAVGQTGDEVEASLEKAGLVEQLGNRIIIMSVAADSSAAVAFGKLFGDKNMYDLRGQKIEKVLENKELVAGLSGAV